MFRGAASKVTWIERPKKALVLALVMVAVATLATSLLLLAAATRPAEAAFPGTNGKIVFTTSDEIYVMESDGTAMTPLTNSTTTDKHPSFSSDGSRIVFNSGTTIHVMNADGSGKAPLTPGLDPAFSPDGSKIAFVDLDNIWVMNVDGSDTPTNLTNDAPNDITPAWSPDGSKIAFAAKRVDSFTNKSSFDILVMNADGSGTPTNLTNTTKDEVAPAWSPDGSRIAFQRKDPSSPDSDIFVMNSDGTGEAELFGFDPITGDDRDFQANPAFSPDGSRIAYAARRLDPFTNTSSDGIWLGNADGSGTPTKVANTGGPEAELDWGPLSFDLSLVQSDSPDPVKVNNNLTYTLEVTNEGFDDAPGVVLTDSLPLGVTFVSAGGASAKDGCTHASGKVTCNLGTVAKGATVTRTIIVTPTAADTITNTASVGSSVPELTYTANNSDRERTEVTLNRAPVANDDSYVTTEDRLLAVSAPGVLSDDTDADGDPLTLARVIETTSGGTLGYRPDGSFTYTPNNNFNGADAFTYAATDGTAQSNVATVTIVVRAVNDPPNAADDSAQTEKDTPLNVNVLANDRDPERDEISITNVSDPAHGTATLNSDDTVRYAPEAGYTGSDPFTYTVSDGNGGTDTGTVTITVSDTKAPTVTSTTPTNKATGVSPTANVTATFSEVMNTSTINGTTFTLKRGTTKIQAKVFLDPANNRKWILDPSFPLAKGTIYVATVTTGAQDLVGNTLDQNPSVSGNQPKRWSFKVRA